MTVLLRFGGMARMRTDRTLSECQNAPVVKSVQHFGTSPVEQCNFSRRKYVEEVGVENAKF